MRYGSNIIAIIFKIKTTKLKINKVKLKLRNIIIAYIISKI